MEKNTKTAASDNDLFMAMANHLRLSCPEVKAILVEREQAAAEKAESKGGHKRHSDE